MTILRRSLPWAARATGNSSLRAQRSFLPHQVQLLQRRRYADAHGHEKGFGEGSDIPWAVGAITVTGLGSYWILSNDPTKHSDHGDHGDHGGHESGHGESESSGEDEESSSGESSEEASNDSGDEAQDTPESSDDEGDAKNEASSEQKDNSAEESTEKKSVDKSEDTPTDKLKEKTEENSEEKYDDSGARTKAMHKSMPHGDARKSQKSEGVVETAKLNQTIDPSRKSRDAKD